MKLLYRLILNYRDKHLLLIDILVFVSMFAMGLNVLATNRYFVIILGALLAFKFAPEKIIKPPLEFYLVLLFSFSYAFFYSIFYCFDSSFIKHFLTPLIFYALGLSKNPKTVFKCLLFYLVGMLLATFLNLGRTIAETGIAINTNQRVYLYFFTGNAIAATLFSPFADLSFAISIVILFYRTIDIKKKWYLYSLSIINIVICIYGLLLLKNRSFLICSFIAFFSFLFLQVKRKWIPLMLITLLFIFYFLISLNAFNLAYTLSKIPFFSRFITGGSNSERLAIYELFFKTFWKHPFGGLSGSTDFTQNYVHNVFLDVYAMGGIIPFALFLAIVVMSFYKMFGLIKIRKNFYDCLIVVSFISLISLFLFEPILQADYYYFSLVFLFGKYFFVQSKTINVCKVDLVGWYSIDV